jgi:hypothetical protein
VDSSPSVEDTWPATPSRGVGALGFGRRAEAPSDRGSRAAREARHPDAVGGDGAFEHDCNENLALDSCDIVAGGSGDANGNGTPDECECIGDIDGDGSVAVSDLLDLLATWGPCGAPCPADLDGDGAVAVADLLALLAAWGRCP